MSALPARLRADGSSLARWALFVNTELLVVLAYFALTEPPGTVRYALLVLYPWVWFTAAAWGIARVDLPDASGRRRGVALAVGLGYFLVLAYVGGLVGPGLGERATGLRVVTGGLPPGFAPAVLYGGGAFVVNLLPFKAVGYATLAALVYATVLDAAETVAAGVVGLFTCVSCAFPVIAAAASALFGGSAAVAVADRAYGLSTLVFVVTVILLAWRPTAADVSRLRARLR